MDRIETIWRWAQHTELYMRHKDLSAEQIMYKYAKDCVCIDGVWTVVDRAVPYTPYKPVRAYMG
jgi:hypothetical protein